MPLKPNQSFVMCQGAQWYNSCWSETALRCWYAYMRGQISNRHTGRRYWGSHTLPATSVCYPLSQDQFNLPVASIAQLCRTKPNIKPATLTSKMTLTRRCRAVMIDTYQDHPGPSRKESRKACSPLAKQPRFSQTGPQPLTALPIVPNEAVHAASLTCWERCANINWAWVSISTTDPPYKGLVMNQYFLKKMQIRIFYLVDW